MEPRLWDTFVLAPRVEYVASLAMGYFKDTFAILVKFETKVTDLLGPDTVVTGRALRAETRRTLFQARELIEEETRVALSAVVSGILAG